MTRTVQWLTVLAVIAIAVLIGAGSRLDSAPKTRSVQPLSLISSAPPGKFDPAQSAALFVGVRQFDGDVPLVRYAVDDAVDLAYAFSLVRKSHLVDPERVVLALSGEPQKEESRDRLRKLLAAGATRTTAGADDLRSLIRQQAARVTSQGILIASFATHGFVDRDGTHYLLGHGSTFDAGTAVSAIEVQDVAARAPRSLLLVDACRERVPSGSRAGDAGPRSTAPIVRRMRNVNGQVVLYAAEPGEFAFDDDEKRNGVFTRAVLDGLACKGPTVKVVNVEQLQKYVHKRVKEWVRKKRRGKGGIQIVMTNDTRLLPLADCHCPAPAQPSEAWRARLNRPVVRFEIADLDGDCSNEVIVNAGGALHVFDTNGALRWTAPDQFLDFFVGSAYRDRRPVLARSTTGFSVFDDEGEPLSTVVRDLRHVSFYRPTTRHDNRIAATSGDTVLLFSVKDPLPEWRLRVSGTIEGLDILHYDKDKKLDIALRTAAGRVVLDVDGHSLNGAKVDPLPRK